MKLRTLFTILIFSVMACGNTFAQDKKDNKKETITYDVSMSCEKCKKKIEKNIAYEKGVTDMQVNLPSKTVTIEYRKDKTTPEKLQQAFEKLGYTAAVHKEEPVKTNE
ncbi:cation transporter [Dysgonomonas sp. 25]|uniref:cation transporter n=1 Tax=Dysgonomonas sp. 25 TaxID=2302933 RepID=UPI0013CFD74C|nr:cation transporter [Dysgonomonas sp. 25]NDV68863.1 heavy-metal-associated domain-containing protein [Dysgonomonas sp. 25]